MEFPKVTVILRGYNYEQTRTIMKAMVKTNIRSVEITLNTPNAIDTIKKTSEEFSKLIQIGAGTIKSLADAKEAIKAGANFILTPIVVGKDVIDECKKNNVKIVVGAMTPTEVWDCYKNGADIVKVFPVVNCGVSYIKNIKAPLGNIPIMAVGGISIDNAKDFLKNGADYLGIGSSLFKKEHIDSNNIDELVATLKKLEESII